MGMLITRARYGAVLVALLVAFVAIMLTAPSVRALAFWGLVTCFVLAAGLLMARTRWLAVFISLLLLGGGYASLRPVCVLIPDEDLAGFNPPIDQRTDVSGVHRLFQKKDDGHWHQCKMAAARWFFN